MSRPRKVGSFLLSRSCECANERAVASRRSTSPCERSAIESRLRFSCAGGRRSPPTTRRSVTVALLALADQHDPVDLVDLHQLDLDAFVAAGRQVLADVVRPDRKLAVAAIGEDGELHAVRTSVLEQRVD